MMKKIFVSFVMAAVVLTITSCTKEGAVGPTGADGAAGVNGTNGTNGTSGTNGTNGTNGINGVVILAADQAAYNAASSNNGGLYYNKFWVNPADGTTPTTANATVTGNPDFFRCKACHGWDLLGTNGQYINRGSTATRPNVSDRNLNSFASTHNIKEVFDAVKHSGGRARLMGEKSLNSNMPDYGLLMTDAQIWDIVKYLKEGRINSDNFYELKTTGLYPTGTYLVQNLGKSGNATAGAAYWNSKCQSCHGATGTSSAPAGTTIGKLARTKTAEMNHLLKFGLPGNSMFSASFVHNITATEMLDLNKALVDTVAYPN